MPFLCLAYTESLSNVIVTEDLNACILKSLNESGKNSFLYFFIYKECLSRIADRYILCLRIESNLKSR